MKPMTKLTVQLRDKVRAAGLDLPEHIIIQRSQSRWTRINVLEAGDPEQDVLVSSQYTASELVKAKAITVQVREMEGWRIDVVPEDQK